MNEPAKKQDLSNKRTAGESPIAAALDLYQQRSNDFAGRIADAQSISRRYSLVRGLTFLAIWVFLGITLSEHLIPLIGYVLTALSAAAFFSIVFIHENAERRLESLEVRKRINEQAAYRLQRRWDKADVPAVKVDAHHEAISKDLDLFGKATLFQMTCLAKTPLGRRTLANWFIETPGVREILSRQQAVRQLAPQVQQREDLQLYGILLKSSKAGPENLVQWAEAPLWLAKRKWLHWLGVVMTSLVLLCISLLCLGIVPKQIGGSAIMLLLLANFIITIFSSGSIHWIFRQVSARAGGVLHYVKLFELSEKMSGDAELLQRIRTTLVTDSHSAYAEMGRLHRIMGFANMRSSGLFFLVYLLVQFLFLWDIHILYWLERWQRRCRHAVGDWFGAIGDWEALASLSQVAHDHPHWCWPTFVEAAAPKIIAAETLGHPLITEEARVCNDVQLGPVGSVLLVTGSNMSGKSTLLRSIGINVTLAQAGCVVCAEQMSLPLVVIESSMRISDSLAGGVSFFMAELKRLKEIVDIAKHYQGDPQRTLLYLLDEILQGTNSRERHIAVQRVLKHLIDSRAIGAVSTHDLDLANAEGIADRCQPVHFRETFSESAAGKKMTFDYQMRSGVATTTNALKLLELVGLTDE